MSAAASSSSASPKTKIHAHTRAGLDFPVGAVRTRVRKGAVRTRCGHPAAVYFTAALQFLASDLLQQAQPVAGPGARISDNHIRAVGARALGDDVIASLVRETTSGANALSVMDSDDPIVLGAKRVRKSPSAASPAKKKQKRASKKGSSAFKSA